MKYFRNCSLGDLEEIYFVGRPNLENVVFIMFIMVLKTSGVVEIHGDDSIYHDKCVKRTLSD